MLEGLLKDKTCGKTQNVSNRCLDDLSCSNVCTEHTSYTGIVAATVLADDIKAHRTFQYISMYLQMIRLSCRFNRIEMQNIWHSDIPTSLKKRRFTLLPNSVGKFGGTRPMRQELSGSTHRSSVKNPNVFCHGICWATITKPLGY